MEVQINKEIREYNESVFFGLSVRQFFCSLLAIVVAVGLYFLLKPVLGLETTSWVCILGAVPFARLGFFSYHGLTAERFLAVWFRSKILEPRKFRSVPKNYYCEVMHDQIKRWEKEGYPHDADHPAAPET